jgi:hypothetical protein
MRRSTEQVATEEQEETGDVLASMGVELPRGKKCARCCHRSCTGRPLSKRLERRLYTVLAALGLFTMGTVRAYVMRVGNDDRG